MRMWELRQNGVVSEPIGEADLEAMLAAGTIEGTTPVRPVGKDAWKPALRHAPFASAAQRAPRREGATPPVASAPPKDPLRWDQQTQLNMPAQPLATWPTPPAAPAAGPPPLPPPPSVAAPPAPPLSDFARTSALRGASARAPAPPGFTGGLFDFTFTTFVTTRVVKAFYVLYVVILGLGTLGSILAGLRSLLTAGARQSDAGLVIGLAQIAAAPLFALFLLVGGRVVFESIIVFFRIAEHLGER